MTFDKTEILRQMNYLASEIDAVYHKASLKLGVSDSILMVMCVICDAGESCRLCDIYKRSGISRQTVNSAIRKLEETGVIYLEQDTGRSKKVFLTEKGKNHAKKTVAILCAAEQQAFDSWTEKELASYIELMKKHVHCLTQQIEKL